MAKENVSNLKGMLGWKKCLQQQKEENPLTKIPSVVGMEIELSSPKMEGREREGGTQTRLNFPLADDASGIVYVTYMSL